MDSLATKINNAYQASSNATADLYSSFTVASNEVLRMHIRDHKILINKIFGEY